MKNLRFVALTLVMLAVFAPVQPAFAHTEASDGRISAFLHIPPQDKPGAGKLNTIQIYYNDKDFRFTTEGCFCKIKINQGKQVLYNGDLPGVGQRIGQVKLVLPADNASYDVVVSGVPKTGGFFQSFKLKFDIDVGTPVQKPTQPEARNPIIPAAGTVILTGGAILFIKLRNRTKIKAGKEDV